MTGEEAQIIAAAEAHYGRALTVQERNVAIEQARLIGELPQINGKGAGYKIGRTQDYNPYHEPAGSPIGGQFASAGSGGAGGAGLEEPKYGSSVSSLIVNVEHAGDTRELTLRTPTGTVITALKFSPDEKGDWYVREYSQPGGGAGTVAAQRTLIEAAKQVEKETGGMFGLYYDPGEYNEVTVPATFKLAVEKLEEAGFAEAHGFQKQILSPSQASELHPQEPPKPAKTQEAERQQAAKAVPSGYKSPAAVTNVGGDEWNKATAARLAVEYEKAHDHLQAIVDRTVSGQSVELGENEEDAPGIPEEWDMLSSSQQDEAFEAWADHNKQSYIDSEVEHWQSEIAPNEAAIKVAEDFKSAEFSENDGEDENDWAREAVAKWRERRREAGQKDPPFTDVQILNALQLDYNDHGYYQEKFIELDFDEDKLQEPIGFVPHPDLPLPGVSPIDPASKLTVEMRNHLKEFVVDRFDARVSDVVDNTEPPDFSDSAKEMLGQAWDSKDDGDKFEIAQQYLDVFTEQSSLATHIARLTRFEPEKLDPLNDTTGQDYKNTQAWAAHIWQARSKQVLKDRTGVDISPSDLLRLDSKLWKGWVSSSTSSEGHVLQLATAEELGGRLRVDQLRHGSYDTRSPEQIIKDLHETADAHYKYAGGYEGVKAAVRAKWETTQFLLDKSGKQVLKLYRGIGIPDKIIKGEREEIVTGTNKNDYTQLPDFKLERNGAASTSDKLGVPESFGNKPDHAHVTIRIEVPRTAVISIPAYGQNMHSEKESVVAGTAWNRWDAWLTRGGGVPTFEQVPLHALAAGNVGESKH